jgi:hypothetical protein
LTERTVAKAAAKSRVDEKTLRRWMAKDDEFRRELLEARRAVFDTAMNRVQALLCVAIDTLGTLMQRNMPPAVRLGAARAVTEIGIHQHDQESILQKVQEIETYQRQHSKRA